MSNSINSKVFRRYFLGFRGHNDRNPHLKILVTNPKVQMIEVSEDLIVAVHTRRGKPFSDLEFRFNSSTEIHLKIYTYGDTLIVERVNPNIPDLSFGETRRLPAKSNCTILIR